MYFEHDDKDAGIELVAEARVVRTSDGVLLFASGGGRLDSLEYMWVGHEPPPEFPPPAQLEVVMGTGLAG